MTSVTCGTSPTEVMAAGNRRFIGIFNNSANTVYLKFDGSATTLTTSNGWPLTAGAWLILTNENNQFGNLVQAISAAGGEDLRVQG